jgi:NAD(P)H-flavin reductase
LCFRRLKTRCIKKSSEEVFLSSPDPNSDWKGLVGRVHNVIEQNETNLKGYDGYVAGSPKVIKAVVETFKNLGMKEERIFYDIAG